MANTYIKKNINFDGYNSEYTEIGNFRDVQAWAKDGSIADGDIVFKLQKCKQPKLAT